MKYKYIIFDCDGTVLNTIKDLTIAVNYALSSLSFPVKTVDEVQKMVGNGIGALVKRALPIGEEKKFDEAFSLFKSYYNEHYADFTKPYEGITQLLTTLKNNGRSMAIVSNKQKEYLDKLYSMFFADSVECAIGDTMGYLPKPAPDLVDYALSVLNASKRETVYVGDSSVDVQTAKNSGIDGIFVSWGFNTKEQLLKCGAKYIIDAPQELLTLI